MKDLYKSPVEDSDSDPEEVESSDSEDQDESADVSMRSLARANLEDMDTDEEDEDYVESGSSDSEAAASGSSLAESVSTNPKSEVSAVAVSEDEMVDPNEVQALHEDMRGPASPGPGIQRFTLLFREINEEQLTQNIPTTTELLFEDPEELQKFQVRIMPDDGYWRGGIINFDVSVPEGYNAVPPEVKCRSKVFHPNIAEDGTVGLNVLRRLDLDGGGDSGWNAGGRTLKDVILGLNSLFTSDVNIEGALNSDAAKLFEEDKEEFSKRVLACMQDHSS